MYAASLEMSHNKNNPNLKNDDKELAAKTKQCLLKIQVLVYARYSIPSQ